MAKEVVVEAASIDDAIKQAQIELSASREEIEFEILVEPENKFFGKNQAAKIRAWVESCDNQYDEEPKESFEEESEVKRELGQDSEEDLENRSSGESEEAAQSYFRRQESLSEEELDSFADAAIAALRETLRYFDAEDATIDEYEGEEGELILDVVGDNLAVLIGRHGKTLDALQFLISSIVSKQVGFRYPLTIDIEGYKQRRRQKLESLAKSSAARAIRQNKDVVLRPMTPYERRIIHVVLKDDPRIATSSEGKEPNRQVIIKVL